jgi:hypothetical protein
MIEDMIEVDFTCRKRHLPHQPSVRLLIRRKVPIIKVPCHISANIGAKEVQCNPTSMPKREIHFRNLKVAGRVALTPHYQKALFIHSASTLPFPSRRHPLSLGKHHQRKHPPPQNTAYPSVQPQHSPHRPRAQHATTSATTTAGRGKRNTTSHPRQPNNPANQCRSQRAQRHSPPASRTTRAQRNPVGGRCRGQ